MTPVKCFWLEPTPDSERYLRRYAGGTECTTCEHGYHQARIPIGTFPATLDAEGYESSPSTSEYDNDGRWPPQAPCGYVFTDEDKKNDQIFVERIYSATDGRTMTLKVASPGAMWNAWWMQHLIKKSSDGLCPQVRCPGGGDWLIDSRASNCTMPGDDTHQCWVRHGAVPDLTVDKNGNTCAAGAGSIQTGNWHGFLRGGFLVE